ncbi:Dihydroxyacid dehydratase/phosphogluconate dehydratase [Pseudomonas syringae pv. actinidiae]|uniref:Dihydroxyacid dehydratase/phosphogluconate dehydratase n=1 Tax=Pseudomonas syringae pv. actinidiae TaxID=103796 RepID=A0A2V0QWY4_PSESF|nr:Dihydroxyacid dehydratase/phosphogluconate dehydratase [Pseudomonas syringae pv. actinidiae]GBH17603.1 Dihydroxyacid dehydratase/phosphogluconate dehydratase [Pseudomonas syringae pv. actinidiae]
MLLCVKAFYGLDDVLAFVVKPTDSSASMRLNESRYSASPSCRTTTSCLAPSHCP